jgi:hypothetical protein
MRKAIRLLGIVALAVLTVSPAVSLQHGDYSVEILVDGKPLHEYHSRNTTYVEALKEKEYSIRLRNRTGRRVAVALSVDGLNSIDARTTSSREARKWILRPYQTLTLDGWQTSTSTARRFFFTTEDRSYGEWLGKTDNLGIVAAVFYRERIPRPVPYCGEDARSEGSGRPAAPRESEARSKSSRDQVAQVPVDSDDYAATGIGREVGHRVRQVSFDAEPRPAASIEIRYEYRDALARLGVLPEPDAPLARRERARGFEDDGFAPDPYRR